MSPNVSITELNNSYYQPYVTPEVSAYVGHFERGPIDYPIWITDVNQFKVTFGRGLDIHQQDWYQVYNYLQYASGIWVIRYGSDLSTNASSHNVPISINLYQDWVNAQGQDFLLGNPFTFVAKTTGGWGNTLTIVTLTKNDWDNNVELIPGHWAKNTFSYFEDGYIGVCVFKSDELVENHYKTLDELVAGGADNPVSSGNYVYMSIDDNVTISDFDFAVFNMSGGDAVFPLPSDVTNSYDILLDETNYNLDSIIGNQLFNEEAIRIAQTRKDCIAYVGLPTELIEFLQVHVNGRHSHVYTEAGGIIVREINKHNKLESAEITIVEDYIKALPYSEFAHFTFNVKIQTDLFTGNSIFVNLAGDIAGLKSQASVKTPWKPSCGLERGQIKNAIGMKFKLTRKLIDQFYKIGCNYTTGNVLMSQRNFTDGQVKNNNIHIRNVTNHVKKEIVKILNSFVFVDNNYSTRYNASYRLKEFLEDIRLHKGIRGAKVFASEGPNNTIDFDVTIYPVDNIEQINLRFNN